MRNFLLEPSRFLTKDEWNAYLGYFFEFFRGYVLQKEYVERSVRAEDGELSNKQRKNILRGKSLRYLSYDVKSWKNFYNSCVDLAERLEFKSFEDGELSLTIKPLDGFIVGALGDRLLQILVAFDSDVTKLSFYVDGSGPVYTSQFFVFVLPPYMTEIEVATSLSDKILNVLDEGEYPLLDMRDVRQIGEGFIEALLGNVADFYGEDVVRALDCVFSERVDPAKDAKHDEKARWDSHVDAMLLNRFE